MPSNWRIVGGSGTPVGGGSSTAQAALASAIHFYPFSKQRDFNEKVGESPSLLDFGAKGDVQVFESGSALSVTASSNVVNAVFATCSGTVTSTGSAVVGTGTAFLSQCAVGNYITASGQTLQIISIQDDTHLTTGLTTALSSFGSPITSPVAFSPALSSASFSSGVGFTALTDVGKRIVIYGAGGSGARVLWMASATAGLSSTNSYATVTVLDAQGATFVGIAGNCAGKGVTWEVYGNGSPSMSGATLLSGPTAITPLATSISYSTSSPAYRYYLVQIVSTVSGQSGTAYVTSIALGYALGATIASVVSPTQATISTNALTTRQSCYAYFGTDDTAAIQQAFNVGTSLGTASSADAGITIQAPRGKYLFSSPMFHKHCVTVQGHHGGGTIFMADGAAMPTGVPLWNMSGTFPADGMIDFFTRLEDCRIDCGHISGSIGIFCDSLQENSGLYRVTVIKWLKYGIQAGSSTDQFGCVNWTVQDPWIYPSDSAFLDSTVCGIIGNYAVGTTIIRGTFLAQGGFVCGYGTAIEWSHGQLNCVGQIHIESANIGLHFDTGSLGVCEAIDTQSTVLVAAQIDAGNPVVLNNIASSSGTTVVDNVQGNTITQLLVSRYVCVPTAQVEILAGALQLNQSFPSGGPNIITLDPVNFGSDKQGGFICVNTRNSGFPNWTQTSASLTYLLGMWLRLAASRFEIMIGTATNTNGTNPATSYLAVDPAYGGILTPRLYFDNTGNLGPLNFGNNLGVNQIRWQHGLSGQGTLVLQYSTNSGSIWSDVFMVNLPTGNIFFPNGANFASGGPFGSGLYSSNGTPNGSISAQPGSVCFDLGGNLWLKTTGSGNTGWSSLTSGITQLTGDVTAGPGSGSQVATISAAAVTLAMMANLAANSIIGNNTGSTAAPIALTASQVLALLFATQAANTVYAGPSSGGSAAPTFRALAAADISGIAVTSVDTMAGPITFTITNSGGGGPQLSCVASGGVEAFALTQPGAWPAFVPGSITNLSSVTTDCAALSEGKKTTFRISITGTVVSSGINVTWTVPWTAKSNNQAWGGIEYVSGSPSSSWATIIGNTMSTQLGPLTSGHVQQFIYTGVLETT